MPACLAGEREVMESEPSQDLAHVRARYDSVLLALLSQLRDSLEAADRSLFTETIVSAPRIPSAAIALVARCCDSPDAPTQTLGLSALRDLAFASLLSVQQSTLGITGRVTFIPRESQRALESLRGLRSSAFGTLRHFCQIKSVLEQEQFSENTSSKPPKKRIYI